MGFLDPNSWVNAFSSDPTGAKGAADTAANAQLSMFNTTQKNLAPYMDTGKVANQNLAGSLPALISPYTLDKYNASPEAAVTNNAMSDMMKQLMAGAAAGGRLGSGNVATALQDNASRLALQGYTTGLQDYQGQNLNTFNMLNTVSGSGQNAAANLGGFGANVANSIGRNAINAAAQTFATQNAARSNLSSAFGAGAGNWLMADSGTQWEDVAGSGNFVDTTNAENIWNSVAAFFGA